MTEAKLFDAYLTGERPRDTATASGLELDAFYGPGGTTLDEAPGEYPFTRGIHPEMYRKRMWTRRQQSGYGTPKESNARLIFLLKQGMTGLNVDYDVPTKLAIDPDHPLAEGDIGTVGTSTRHRRGRCRTLWGHPARQGELDADLPAARHPRSLSRAYVRLAQDARRAARQADRHDHELRLHPARRARTTRPTRLFIRSSSVTGSGLDVMEWCASQHAEMEPRQRQRLQHPRNRRKRGSGSRICD